MWQSICNHTKHQKKFYFGNSCPCQFPRLYILCFWNQQPSHTTVTALWHKSLTGQKKASSRMTFKPKIWTQEQQEDLRDLICSRYRVDGRTESRVSRVCGWAAAVSREPVTLEVFVWVGSRWNRGWGGVCLYLLSRFHLNTHKPQADVPLSLKHHNKRTQKKEQNALLLFLLIAITFKFFPLRAQDQQLLHRTMMETSQIDH